MSEEFQSDASVEQEADTVSEPAPDVAPSEPASESAGAQPSAPSAGQRVGAESLAGPSLASVIDVPLRVTVEIGAAKMLVREVLQLNKGSVVPLDRSSGDPADILVNGRRIARGEVTVLDDSLAVRIVELTGREEGSGGR